MLLTLYLEQWQWPGPAGWDRAAELADLGAIFYAMAAVAVERSIRIMFWAWDQHKKVQAKLRAEGEAVGRAKGETATAQRYERWLAKVAQERGIDLAELLPPDAGSASS